MVVSAVQQSENRNRVTDVENKLMVNRGKGEERDKLGDWD